jgi:hypothetical protein
MSSTYIPIHRSNIALPFDATYIMQMEIEMRK